MSECLSGIATDGGTRIGADTLTWRSTAQERDEGAGGETGPSGSLTWVITITAETSSQTPTEYATARGARNFASTTIDGRPALQVADAFGRGWPAYYVATAGRMYTIYLSVDSHVPQPFAAPEAIFDAIARSVTFATPTARPTPTPAPQLSAEVSTLVDAVAAAFAASDADRLRELMAPKCWFGAGYYQSSGSALSRERMAESLRSSFARGLKVSVESRPIRTDAPFVRGPFWVWATWSAYGNPVIPQSDVQLVFDRKDGSWYWIGALFNAGALRR